MKNINIKKISFFSIIVLSSLLVACGAGSSNDSSGTSGGEVSDKFYLAKNIVFRNKEVIPKQELSYAPSFSFFSKAHASEVDTETKIYAENVIYSTDEEASSIKSTNVQDAIMELSFIFSKLMVGTWNIENKNIGDAHIDTGKVLINDDGTFDLTEGSFAAIGEGSDPSLCNNIDGTEKYIVITDDLIVFEHENNGTTNQVIPQVISLKSDKIILLGSGGCGQVGRQRVSILTREG
jgi:hypothetical protein